MNRMSGHRAGGALLLAIISFLFMAGIGAAIFSLSMAGQRTTMAASNADAAFHVAEAGVDDTINKMRAYQMAANKDSGDYAAVGVKVTLPDGGTGNQISGALHGGTYAVTIEPAYAGLGEYKITSIGLHNGEKRGIETWIHAVEEPSSFSYGLFGEVFVDTGGNVKTDGYNSTKGLRKDQITTTIDKVEYANMTGHLGSNGAVEVGGSAVIFGNATPGSLDESTGNPFSVGGGGKVYGSKDPAKQDLSLAAPDFTVPSGATALKAFPTKLSGGAYTIASIKAAGKSSLTITGDVTLYVNGDYDFSGQTKLIINKGSKLTVYQNAPTGDFKINGGNTTNTSLIPESFMFYTNAKTGTLNGNADFFGTIYAPPTAMKIAGNAGLFGSTVAKSIDVIGNPFFHYDEALGAIKSSTIVFNVKSYHQFVP